MKYWSRLVTIAFGCGLIAMFLTAHFGAVSVGNEIWWEIPLVVGLTISVLVIK